LHEKQFGMPLKKKSESHQRKLVDCSDPTYLECEVSTNFRWWDSREEGLLLATSAIFLHFDLLDKERLEMVGNR
jgi:hypothetical protein